MYIYVISHPKFEGWVKIGKTKNPKLRFSNYQTYCPLRQFKLEYTKYTNKTELIEDYFKLNIKGNGFEWFNCSVHEAISIINKQLEIMNQSGNCLEDIQKRLSPRTIKNLPSRYQQIKFMEKFNYEIEGRIYNADSLIKLVGEQNIIGLYYYLRRGEKYIYTDRYKITKL